MWVKYIITNYNPIFIPNILLKSSQFVTSQILIKNYKPIRVFGIKFNSIKYKIVITWNHKLLTTLLKRNNGTTQNAPNVKFRNGWIHDHTNVPSSGAWPNTRLKSQRILGNITYSKRRILSQKTPPLRAQHWQVLFKILLSLKKIKNFKRSQNAV